MKKHLFLLFSITVLAGAFFLFRNNTTTKNAVKVDNLEKNSEIISLSTLVPNNVGIKDNITKNTSQKVKNVEPQLLINKNDYIDDKTLKKIKDTYAKVNEDFSVSGFWVSQVGYNDNNEPILEVLNNHHLKMVG